MGKTGKLTYIPKNGLDEREVALCVLLSVTETGRKSHLALSGMLRASELGKKDRALVTAISEGTLEQLIRIDYILSRYVRKPLRFLDPEARGILRMSVYQILFMDRIPDSAACNEAVAIAKLRGRGRLSGFINAVLRNIVRDKEADPDRLYKYPEEHIAYSVPKWLYKKLCAELGRGTARSVFQAWLTRRGQTIRLNTSLMDEEGICKLLDEEGAKVKRIDFAALLKASGCSTEGLELPIVYELSEAASLTELSAFKRGLIAVQDIASMLPAVFARPAAGDHIIDICAAPGGKALQLCDMLRGSGLVEARDVSEAKAQLIRENALRMGFKNIDIKVMDALVPDEESYYRADIVMADLPCSGLGIVGRKPDIKLNIRSYSIEELRDLQREMLSIASRYVKPHGRLVYSTCTITREENEDNVQWAASHLGFQVTDTIRLLPAEDHDGFFVAVLQKEFI